MFIKVTTSGGRRYAQLVESFRNEAGQPRQRTLATLGRLEPGGDVDRLIAALSRAQGRADAPVSSARITDLRFLEARAAGDVWALWQLWRALPSSTPFASFSSGPARLGHMNQRLANLRVAIPEFSCSANLAR